ncbi:MAG: hypothetical protein WAW91_03340 [Candidatus Nanoperiomorbaceae bacterium]
MDCKSALKTINETDLWSFVDRAMKILVDVETSEDLELDEILTLAARAMGSECSEIECKKYFAELKRKIAALE